MNLHEPEQAIGHAGRLFTLVVLTALFLSMALARVPQRFLTPHTGGPLWPILLVPGPTLWQVGGLVDGPAQKAH